MGIILQEIDTFHLLARKLLVSQISALQLASLSIKNAHHRDHRSHLTGFCIFNCNFISPHVITRGCIDNFIWAGFSRQIDTTYRLIFLKTLVYTKTRVVAPSFLFTPVGTVTGDIVTLLLLLKLTSFLSLYIGLKHGQHEGHTLITPNFLVGLLGLRGLTCYCREELTIAIVATVVQGVLGLVGATVGFAMLAKLLTANRSLGLDHSSPQMPSS